MDVKFDFYRKLSNEKKLKYDLMLHVHFLLLSCDEFDFYESKESKISRTWLFSFKHILNEFSFSIDAYPEGSLTANRFFVDLTHKYLINNEVELNDLREKTFNFLSYRRDDDSYNNSYLFGSTYDIITYKASRSIKPKKIVDVGLRHSISALCTILVLTQEYSKQLLVSLSAVNKIMVAYLGKNEEWQLDKYKFLTLASFIKLYNSLNRESLDPKLANALKRNYEKCVRALLNDEECITEKLNGGYDFAISPQEDVFKDYHYFFVCNALTLIPDLLNERRLQLIIKELINNGIESQSGFGIPVFPITHDSAEEIKPDFGISSSVLYLLWYCLEHDIGDRQWLIYCEDHFEEILDFCINSFDKIEYYQFLLAENYSKILHMPNFSTSVNLELRQTLKNAIHKEVIERKKYFSKAFMKLNLQDEHNIILDIVNKWNIKSMMQNMDSKYKYSKDIHILIGEFIGAFYKVYSS